MRATTSLLIVIAGISLLLASMGWADVPAPPVNQTLGMNDIAIGTLVEADCRICHATGVPDRHHLLYEQPIPPGSFVPFPDADGDGVPDTTYGCLNCHDTNFSVVRDCVVCHTASPHHSTAPAQTGDCVACHGDLVDNMDDGHYIPTYSPSLVTPALSNGAGQPLNSRGNGAGACDYCHDDDGLASPVILTNMELHHSTGFGADSTKCSWCHDISSPPEERIRTCEGCHGPDSLHNIQADSPNPNNIGTIVVGGEDAGYGHIGRDAGSGDSDCWGCHGFAISSAPGTGPVIPSVFSADSTVIGAGTDTPVTLTGSSFTNLTHFTQYESDVALTAADGSWVVLTPDVVEVGSLTVTIPGDIAPGNYDVQAVKADVASNPTVISIVPEVMISEATGGRTVTITGSGFGGFAEGSGTSVTGEITTGWGQNRTTTTVEAAIASWSDTTIQAEFGSRPDEVTVFSVFGNATSVVASSCGVGFELALLVPPLMWLHRRRRLRNG